MEKKEYILLPPINSNEKVSVICKQCNERKEHHAKGHCYKCYKRYKWKKKIIICKSCGRRRGHQAFGLCSGCHMRLHHYDMVLAYNAKKNHDIDYALYRKVTKKCDSCGFDKLIHIHHLNGNTRDNDLKNLVGLCPNCHKMIHSYKYYEEIRYILKQKGFDVTKVHPTNYVKD